MGLLAVLALFEKVTLLFECESRTSPKMIEEKSLS